MKWLAILLLTSCVTEVDGDSDDADLVDTSGETAFATVAGVNSAYCTASPYNCRFRAGDSRVDTKSGLDSWGIVDGAEILDGNGDAMSVESGAARMTFNYGQKRSLAGTPHALALSTSNASAGWYPIDHIPGNVSFDEQVGDVVAKGAGLAAMACYEIRDAADETLAAHKVVKGSTETNERAGPPDAGAMRGPSIIAATPGSSNRVSALFCSTSMT